MISRSRKVDFYAERLGWEEGEPQYELDVSLMHDVRVGLSEFPDLDSAIELAEIVRRNLEAHETAGNHELTQHGIHEAIFALRTVCDRIGIQVEFPFEDYESFRNYSIARAVDKSWAARRALLQRHFGPLQQTLLDMKMLPDHRPARPVVIKPMVGFVLQQELTNLSGSSIDAYFMLVDGGPKVLADLTARKQSKAARAQKLVGMAQSGGPASFVALTEAVLSDALDGKLGSDLLPRVLSALEGSDIVLEGRVLKWASDVGATSRSREDARIEVKPDVVATAPNHGIEGKGTSFQMSDSAKPVDDGEKRRRHDRRTVFLVNGRYDAVTEALIQYLSSLDLRVLHWEEVVAATGETNPYIGDVIAKGMAMATAIVVLFTPDDRVQLDGKIAVDADADELKVGRQPRPNVLIEAGMALAIDPRRTLIVQFGRIRPATDLDGKHLLKIGSTVPTWRHDMVARLRNAGLEPVTSSSRYLTAGTFPASGLKNASTV